MCIRTIVTQISHNHNVVGNRQQIPVRTSNISLATINETKRRLRYLLDLLHFNFLRIRQRICSVWIQSNQFSNSLLMFRFVLIWLDIWRRRIELTRLLFSCFSCTLFFINRIELFIYFTPARNVKLCSAIAPESVQFLTHPSQMRRLKKAYSTKYEIISFSIDKRIYFGCIYKLN